MILRGWPRPHSLFLCAIFAIVACSVFSRAADAHEPTIAVMDLREVGAAGHYIGEWSLPPVDPLLKPIFPPHCTWMPPELDCGDRDLVGRLSFEGLGSDQSATMIRVIAKDGSVQAYTLSAARPDANLVRDPGQDLSAWLELADIYINLGIDHILMGIDHLMFVLGLIWLVSSVRMLVKTITSFTVAHSISLATATFGWVGVPERPLNAAIALSIVFVGIEIVKLRRGEMGLTARQPWLVAFAFGLLHGLGFATALTNLGLPQSALPPALLFFNIGVEIGQLAFVFLVLALMWAHRRIAASLPRWASAMPAYLIGSIATYWFLARMELFLVG